MRGAKQKRGVHVVTDVFAPALSLDYQYGKAGEEEDALFAECIPDPFVMEDAVVLHIDLERALSSLPAPWRRALELSVIQGMSAKEIGKELGVSATTIFTWIARAKQLCREKLCDDE